MIVGDFSNVAHILQETTTSHRLPSGVEQIRIRKTPGTHPNLISKVHLQVQKTKFERPTSQTNFHFIYDYKCSETTTQPETSKDRAEKVTLNLGGKRQEIAPPNSVIFTDFSANEFFISKLHPENFSSLSGSLMHVIKEDKCSQEVHKQGGAHPWASRSPQWVRLNFAHCQ